jgi:hypothetical protein
MTEQRIDELEQLRRERDQLYWHCKALVEMVVNLRFNPVATYAAAYLTQIVPPPENVDARPVQQGEVQG